MKILDRLIGSLRGCCHSLPDLRQGGGTRYTMADIGFLAVFLVFLPKPVLPAKPVVPGAPAPSGGGPGAVELPDAVRPDGDLRSQVSLGLWTSVRFAPRCAFGAPSSVPSDNHVRALLDPVSPDHFHPVFAEVVAELERSGGLEAFRQLGGHVLIALDGTEYHVSGKVHCQQCSTRKRGKDRTEHFHAMVSATVVAPDHNRVVPLEPEFIVPQDGHEKQDCE